jgi:hypothetical protein
MMGGRINRDLNVMMMPKGGRRRDGHGPAWRGHFAAGRRRVIRA